jgi:hypothetical protein
VVTGGPVSVVNAGNVAAPAVVRFDGPVDTPRVTHVGQTRTVIVQADIPAGQYLTLDLDTGQARLNGQVARRTSGRMPSIEPGVNVLRFDAASYEADAAMTVTWRDAHR